MEKKREIIVLDDDDDDDDYDSRDTAASTLKADKKKRSRTPDDQCSTGENVVDVAPFLAVSLSEPPRPPQETLPVPVINGESKSSDPNMSAITYSATSRRPTIAGCMLRPTPSPIKLFATQQDEDLRAALLSSLSGSPTQSLWSHWSYEQCWTVREMIGLDRFSDLLTEPSYHSDGDTTTHHDEISDGSFMNNTKKSLNRNSECFSSSNNNNNSNLSTVEGIGVDFLIVVTYILGVGDLLTEIPELPNIPNVVVIYEDTYPEMSTDGLLSLSLSSFGQQGEPDSVRYWKRAAKEHVRRMSRGSSNNDGIDSDQRFRGVTFIRRSPKADPGSDSNPTRLDGRSPPRMEFGCHHTKMFIVGYSSGRLRVNVHTSNLGSGDLHHKCQGAFIQDFLPKAPEQLFDPPSDFENTFITYLESYTLRDKCQWRVNDPEQTMETLTAHLQSYDFSTAKGVLIPSVPGYHSPTIRRNRSKQQYGYVKLSQAIRENTSKPTSCQPLSNPIVFQFSSFGSLSAPYLDKLVKAVDVDSVHDENGSEVSQNPYLKKESAASRCLRIVWPTFEEVSKSVEGINGGGSAPADEKNVQRQFIQPLLSRWSSRSMTGGHGGEDRYYYKGCNIPHIKTFYQVDSNSNNTDMRWFLLSSHNISKLSWGEIQNRQVEGETCVIGHWELGVLVSPITLGVQSMGVSETSESKSIKERAIIPLPYKFHPDPYTTNDKPWWTR